MSSHVVLKTVWILISWFLQKPADLDLHCLQERYKFICTIGQVKFSLDKYIMAIYLSLDK